MAIAKNLQASDNQVIDQVVDIIRFMGENKLAEIELETTSLKLKLKKHSSVHVHTVHAPLAHMAMPMMPVESTAKKSGNQIASAEKAVITEVKTNFQTVVSPMSGTYYSAPSPDSQPFIKEGDSINAGQTICIVEAMKMMNEIKSDKSGKVTKILIANGKPIEKGAVIIHIGE